MTLKTLKKALAAYEGVSGASIERIYKQLATEISAELSQTGECRLPLLGTLRTHQRKGYTMPGRNPRTGEPLGPVVVPPTVRVSFAAHKDLEDAVNS